MCSLPIILTHYLTNPVSLRFPRIGDRRRGQNDGCKILESGRIHEDGRRKANADFGMMLSGAWASLSEPIRVWARGVISPGSAGNRMRSFGQEIPRYDPSQSRFPSAISRLNQVLTRLSGLAVV